MINGQIPSSDLARIKGNGWLRKEAAASWNAMAAAAAKDGVDLSIWESSMRRTYRPRAAQVMARNYWCGQGRCGNAAIPGTSNHGLGETVDLMNMTQRQWIDRHGAQFGWSKSWSDAPWEWWHIRYKHGIWNGKPPSPKGPPTLRVGKRGIWVSRAQNALRRLNVAGAPRTTGVFGPKTRAAVKRLQQKHGLKADGTVGPKTWKILLNALK